MGIRILKEGTQEYEHKIHQLKTDQLEIEALRWLHLTHKPKGQKDGFLVRYHQIQQQGTINPEQKCQGITSNISVNKTSLANIQGNMDISLLKDLLDISH